MIAPQSSLSRMELLRSHLKLTVSLLICSAVLACTCAAYDVDVRHMWSRLLRAAGLGPVPSYVATREIIFVAGNEITPDGRKGTCAKGRPGALTPRFAGTG